jgi:hypothetical protein
MDPWNAGIKGHQPWGVESALVGWRERRGRWAAQVIEHWHPDHGLLIEIDFDRYNPRPGAYYEIGHAIECLWHRVTKSKTDPFRVAKEREWAEEENDATTI